MVRRRFHSPQLDDEVPYVLVGSVLHSLREGASGRFDHPVLLYGVDDGRGITRTLQEFFWEMKQTGNPYQQIAAAIDFYEIGDRPLGHILFELRNQLMTSCNLLKIDDADKFFKDFDVGYDLWANLHYRKGMKPPLLVPSNRQVRQKRNRKIVTNAGLGILSGGVIQTDLLGGWVEAAIGETTDQVSDGIVKNIGRKYRKWARKAVGRRSERLKGLLKGKDLTPVFASEVLEFLFEDAVMNLNIHMEKNEKSRIIFAIDSLDEYETERGPVSQRREWFCHFIEAALPKPILVALGSRGQPKQWHAGLVDVSPQEENIVLLPKNAVEKKLNTIDEERASRVVAKIFPDGTYMVKAIALADAWGACADG